MPRGRTAQGEIVRSQILAQIQDAQLPPTNRELANILGVDEHTIRAHVSILIKAGLLGREPKVSRGLRLTTKGLQWLAERTQQGA